jgi:hypothetical protein
MSYITESQLAGYRLRSKTFSKNDVVTLNESLSRDKNKPMVFLSHKHEELSILQDVVAFLNTEGVEIYVDWMDQDMPAYTSAKTAILLKEKIKVSNKFILIATPAAINSKWCNWELGLGDAAKYLKHIALFPINRTTENFKDAEYLRIYPYIEYRDGTTTYRDGSIIPKGFYVFTPSDTVNTISPLKKWLKN